MSEKLADINVAGAAVGQRFTLPLGNKGFYAGIVDPDMTPTLQIFNESGMGFTVITKTESHSFDLPAGAWRNVSIANGESQIDFIVDYVLPNPPVSLIKCTYYEPGETVDPIGQLGNSPIGIGGNVQTSSVQTLSNEGNPIGTLVFDMGPSGNLNIVQLWNDHFTWSVVIGGVAHTVLQGKTTGNPLQIGQSGDISEVLGNLTVDQTLHETGGLIDTDSVATDLIYNVLTGQAHRFRVNNADAAFINSTGVILDTIFSKLSGGTDGVIAVTGTGATQNTRLQSGALINLQVPGGTSQAVVDNTGFTVGPGQLHLVVGDLRHFNGNTSTIGSGTVISHGLGITPRLVQLTSNIAQPGSANVGVGSFTATTFTASVGAGSSGCWLAIKE